MPRDSHSRKVAFANMVCKSTGNVIPQSDVRYIKSLPATRERLYQIRSPLTHMWLDFTVSDAYYHAGCIPQVINEFSDYYCSMVKSLDTARDIQVFNHDVRAITTEESKIFGVAPYPATVMTRRYRPKFEYSEEF